ncbi:hypothetical protein N183_26395 [Sinorhizobium sp. Sb3]|uniref:ChaB family protein n=1 Tax=Sinorhizobium/Ensifer group TaxID=227292 RepID=UPI00071E37E0|nr:ChaB family protein [Sinorhizobium sp. Sb3]KSV72399.1 hypothetical protein N183_26395 [Sinorhizobium sp. Sb3]
MPYASNLDLPASLWRVLPGHAPEAFNHAFVSHQDDPRQEETSHRTAWGAVKRRYVKVGDGSLARTPAADQKE